MIRFPSLMLALALTAWGCTSDSSATMNDGATGADAGADDAEAANDGDTSERTTVSGRVRGLRGDDDVVAFLGVPYAAPPLGDLRFRRPMPAPAWDGVREATAFGKSCISVWKDDPLPAALQSEDCLTANVWTSAGARAKQPVMVWVHGGGFQFGSSSDPSTEGRRLAQEGVVVVSFNYRVGPFGFLVHPALDEDRPSGNYGLYDQLAALRWVRDNIDAFGGDPYNVTLFGESAGAHAIGLLLACPESEGLVHRAILQSGAFWDSEHGPLLSRQEASALGERLADELGAQSADALREAPAEVLRDAALWDFTIDPVAFAFSPSVDGVVVPDVPARRYESGEQLAVPVLVGWNEAEYWPFQAQALPHDSPETFRAALRGMFGDLAVEAASAAYPSDDGETTNTSALALIGDLKISEQTYRLAELQAELANVYVYRFSYQSAYAPLPSHFADVPFVFGTLTPQFILPSSDAASASDRAFSDRLIAYWAQFARTGDPNAEGSPAWPRFNDAMEVLELANEVAPSRFPERERFAFIGSLRDEGVLPKMLRD